MEEDSKELWEGEKKKKKSKESLVGNGWGGGELKEEIGRVDSAYVA